MGKYLDVDKFCQKMKTAVGGCGDMDCRDCAIHRSEKTNALTEWISTKDRLPDDYKKVLFITNDGKYYIGFVSYEGWHGGLISMISNVTHWMPLPEPPKEDA